MAPELVMKDTAEERKEYTLKADIFSFGVVVYEIFCNCNPFAPPTQGKFGYLKLVISLFSF